MTKNDLNGRLELMSTKTVRTFLLVCLYLTDCFICKGGLHINFLPTRSCVLTSHFNLQVPSLCYGDIYTIAFHTVYVQSLLNSITIKISNNMRKQLTHNSCWSQGLLNSVHKLGPIDKKFLKRHGCRLNRFVHLKRKYR